eukprot:3494302-Rhodomonas_salina.2
MKSDSPMAAMNANVAKALAPAVAAFSVAAPAFAEGTGEALGVDDGRLLVPLVLIPVFIAILFSNFASTQNQRAQSAVEPDNITVLQFNCVWIS